jgi:short-subunit dehydrogenase
MKKSRRIIIVGGTSGLGLEMARQLIAMGDQVAIVGRNMLVAKESLGDSALYFPHDVTNTDEAPQLLQEITRQLGGLDLFIYSAGVMPVVGQEEFDFSKDKEMLDVNVVGAVAWLDEVAARMLGSKHGSILVIGSVAGDRGRPAQPVYNSSKKFLHTYCEAIRHRLNRVGVNVAVAKPGPMVTQMTAHLDQSKMMPVSLAASKCLKLVGRNGEFYLTLGHRIAMAIIKVLPGFVLRRTKL